jgi:hypothetical protein
MTNSTQILTKDEKSSQSCERPTSGKHTGASDSGKRGQLHCLNRDHVVVATFSDDHVTITTPHGLRLIFKGTAADLRCWADELTENVNSNFAVIRNSFL